VSAPRRTRVLLVDDHALLRSGLRLLIGAQPDLEVVGEAGDLAQALGLARSRHPDVVTLDLTLPDGSGLAAIETLRAAAPAARILVLTMHEDPALVRSALAAGASGYLAKSAADSALIAAIRAVERGRFFVEVQNREAMEALVTPGRVVSGAPAPIAMLSGREREVLVLLAQGHTNQAIADRLALSVKTVESYRARLLQKLGLKNRAELTRLAIDLGLVGRAADPPVEG
jgi:DNA-binding NarL/FixJ family response regulator